MLSSAADSNVQPVCQAISHDLTAVGIDAQIKSEDSAAYLELRSKGKADAYIAYWLMDYNDPANILAVFFGGPEATASRGLNYPDAKVMEEVAHARFIVDDDERKATYQRLEQKIVMEDVAWVPLVEKEHLFCMGERVRSFTPHWAGYGDFYIADVVLESSPAVCGCCAGCGASRRDVHGSEPCQAVDSGHRGAAGRFAVAFRPA